ncbi:hypothetical protein I7I50_12398 [Histoplasma capsulatum G186AR]|uniref:Uncharacterized protein n=1 Tax=Ajellomyces capsulatus TaxID=5037 RepID=A0A8H8CQZ9_AJECA|nr:hypothetical protein I7I52_11296 [Histoplasma capsulatum]QSS70682.1 hypothetical protein I7I50_12398 [Histoplasma capsulatum G186AR]
MKHVNKKEKKKRGKEVEGKENKKNKNIKNRVSCQLPMTNCGDFLTHHRHHEGRRLSYAQYHITERYHAGKAKAKIFQKEGTST